MISGEKNAVFRSADSGVVKIILNHLNSKSLYRVKDEPPPIVTKNYIRYDLIIIKFKCFYLEHNVY